MTDAELRDHLLDVGNATLDSLSSAPIADQLVGLLTVLTAEVEAAYGPFPPMPGLDETPERWN